MKRGKSSHSSCQQHIKQIDWLNYFNQLLFRENMLLTSEEAALPEYDLVLNDPITYKEIMMSIKQEMCLSETQGPLLRRFG